MFIFYISTILHAFHLQHYLLAMKNAKTPPFSKSRSQHAMIIIMSVVEVSLYSIFSIKLFPFSMRIKIMLKKLPWCSTKGGKSIENIVAEPATVII